MHRLQESFTFELRMPLESKTSHLPNFSGKRFMVGARGFEPPTSCTPCKRASRTAPRPDCYFYPTHSFGRRDYT